MHPFDTSPRNGIRRRRDTREGVLSVVTPYRRKEFEVSVGEIKRIRRLLHLDPDHGVDSLAFHGDLDRIDGFINEYRQVLTRLGDA